MKPFEAWIPIYPGDWIRDTMHLDATCNGAYWFLILAHWGKPGIPSDDKLLRSICRVGDSQWDAVKGILKQFFFERDGLWINKRCCEEFEKARSSYQKQCERTKRATLARSISTPNPPPESTNGHAPEWEHVVKWLEFSRQSGSDYTEKEARSAFLALQANGFKWGRNLVADWRAAIECKIQDARQSKPAPENNTRRKQLI